MSAKRKVIKRLKEQTKDINPLFAMPECEPLRTKETAKIILDALKQGNVIMIAGDYDLDGMTATTVLYDFLSNTKWGKQVSYLIPSRIKDGYGISKNIVDYALARGADMIVTVDNGISAVEAVDYANNKGVRVVITDHHTAPAILPKAEVILNPKLDGYTEEFPYWEISGATVAWFLVRRINSLLEKQEKQDVDKYLDLVGITVISDVMPIRDINVFLVNQALDSIKKLKRRIYTYFWNKWSAVVVDVESIAFGYVPYLNAIGRLGDANYAVEFMLSKDKGIIHSLYNYANKINGVSKNLKLQYKNEAVKKIGDIGDAKCIVYKNKQFHEGIVGIIAGKLAEHYGVPAYVFTYSEEKGVWKGSGRTVGDVHLFDLTSQAKKHILGYGGHKGAVGLAIKDRDFESFSKLVKDAAARLSNKLFIDKSLIPIEATLAEMTPDLFEKVLEFGPFGHENKEPYFKIKGCIKEVKKIKKEHAKAVIYDKDGNAQEALFFFVDQDHLIQIAKQKKEVEILVKGMKGYDVTIKDFGWSLNAKVI